MWYQNNFKSLLFVNHMLSILQYEIFFFRYETSKVFRDFLDTLYDEEYT